MKGKENSGDPRMEYFIDIVVRLQERGHDIAAMPMTLQSVRDVLAVADEILAEDAPSLSPWSSDGPDDNSFETLLVLNEGGMPAGALERIEAIIEANETVCFQEFFHDTANSDAATWDEYMNRGNARAELGRYADALEDYAVAEALADQPADRAMVASNRAQLLLKLEGREDPCEGRWDTQA